MKKVGQFFFIFIPVLLALALQFAATFYTAGITQLTRGLLAGRTGADFSFDWMLRYLTGTDFSNTTQLVYALFCVVLFGLWFYAKYEGDLSIERFRDFRPLSVLGILLLVPGGQLLSGYIVSFTSFVFPQWLENYENLLEMAGLNDPLSPMTILYGVILGPIEEELIFRGVTMRQAKKCLPFWAANLLQAVIFGAYHMNMLQGVYAACLGILFGYICERGNIQCSMLLHILFNFWGLILSQYIPENFSTVTSILMAFGMLPLMVCGLLFFRTGTKHLNAGHGR